MSDGGENAVVATLRSPLLPPTTLYWLNLSRLDIHCEFGHDVTKWGFQQKMMLDAGKQTDFKVSLMDQGPSIDIPKYAFVRNEFREFFASKEAALRDLAKTWEAVPAIIIEQ